MSMFDNYDPNSVSDKPVVGQSYDKFVKLDYNQPLDMKLMIHPVYKDAQGNPLRVFFYKSYWFDVVRNGKTLRLSRPSLTLSGEATDPQDEFVKKIREKMTELKKDGQDATEQYAKLDKLYKKFRATNNAVFLFVRPGSSKIEALQVPATVADEIFGKTAFGDKPAQEGLFSKMKAAGRNPFDIKSPKGWIRVTKTGTTWNDTKYPVEEPKVEIVDEDGDTTYKNFTGTVSPELFKLTVDDIPDIKKMASQFSWSAEEVSEYLSSKGTKIPSRVIEGNKQEKVVDEEVEVAAPIVKPTVKAEVKPTVKPTVKAEPVKAVVSEVTTSTDDDLDSIFDGM